MQEEISNTRDSLTLERKTSKGFGCNAHLIPHWDKLAGKNKKLLKNIKNRKSLKSKIFSARNGKC